MRQTKLICTVGPASTDRLPALAEAGMDVARVNFSHGTDDQRRRAFEAVGAAEQATGRAVAILADLAGPKVRLGAVSTDALELEEGASFVLTSGTGPYLRRLLGADEPSRSRGRRPAGRPAAHGGRDGGAERRRVPRGGGH